MQLYAIIDRLHGGGGVISTYAIIGRLHGGGGVISTCNYR